MLLFTFLFVGGHSTIWGILVATPALWALTTYLPESIAAWKDVIYGGILVTAIVVRPNGLIDKRLLSNIRKVILAGIRWGAPALLSKGKDTSTCIRSAAAALVNGRFQRGG